MSLLRGFSSAGIWLAATAGVLLLLAPSSGVALRSLSEQETSASILSEVSWGSASGCIQNVQTNDFGELTPAYASPTLGEFAASPSTSASTNMSGDHVWVGCVTSNVVLNSVVAQGIADMKDAKGDVLPTSAVAIGVTDHPGGAAPAGCAINAGQSAPDPCQLPNDGVTTRTLVSEVPAGTTELDWQYQLDLSANQARGTYGGGKVVLTATAGGSVSSAPQASLTPSFTSAPAQGVSVGLTGVSFRGTPVPSLAYQWRDCAGLSLSSCSNIFGATSATYTPVASDQGFYLSALVTATNGYGSARASVLPVAVDVTYMQAVEADHPVADWTFNDPVGSTSASDSTGWGNLNGASPTFGVAGSFTNAGTAMTLSSGVMSHAGTPLASPTTFAVEIWFKATSGDISGSFDEYIVANQEGAIWLGLASCTAKTGFQPGNCLDFIWQKPSVEPPVVQTGYRFTDTNWHYIVMTHGSDGFTHVYVDGVEYGPFNSSSIYNGYTFGTLVGGLKGAFSHYAYYNTELSSKRVAVHWQASKTS